MKLKILKATKIADMDYPIDAVIEIEDKPTCDALTASGEAVEYTEDMEAQEATAQAEAEKDLVLAQAETIKAEAKSFKAVQTKQATAEGAKRMKGILGKAIKEAIETKAVAAVGGIDASDIMGIVTKDSRVFGKCRQLPVTGSTIRVVYSKAQSDGTEPDIGIIGEATANAVTVELGSYDAVLGKWFATVSIPNEYIDDVDGMEDFVIQELKNKLNIVLDNSVLNGTFGSSIGFQGLAATDLVSTAAFAALATPTKAELQAMAAKVLPEVQDNSVWVVSPAFWAACVEELMDDTNLNGQLITDGKDKTLFGYPVIVTVAAKSTAPVFFGDLSRYCAGVKKGIEVEVDKSASFATDSTVVKIRIRAAGGLGASTQTWDSVVYGAMVRGIQS